jgi:preprotein translocase subunit SecE
VAEKVEKKKENRIQRWWRETLGEMRKVSWPTLQEARRLTLIVIVVMIAMAVLLGTFDFIFSRLVALLLA